jgi:hypothetical protein
VAPGGAPVGGGEEQVEHGVNLEPRIGAGRMPDKSVPAGRRKWDEGVGSS